MKYLFFAYNIDAGVYTPALARKIFSAEVVEVGATRQPGVGVVRVGSGEVTDVYVVIPNAPKNQIRDLHKLVAYWCDGGDIQLNSDLDFLDRTYRTWCVIGKTLLDIATERMSDVRTMSTHVLEDEGGLIHFKNYNVF